MTRADTASRVVAAPPERVWRALVERASSLENLAAPLACRSPAGSSGS